MFIVLSWILIYRNCSIVHSLFNPLSKIKTTSIVFAIFLFVLFYMPKTTCSPFPDNRERKPSSTFRFYCFGTTDQERPRVDSCPNDTRRETNKNEIRVTWDYPTFVDNFDRPPVQLRINSNRNPGALFPWGRYQVLYTATDRAGNKATCEFYVEVGRKFTI